MPDDRPINSLTNEQVINRLCALVALMDHLGHRRWDGMPEDMDWVYRVAVLRLKSEILIYHDELNRRLQAR